MAALPDELRLLIFVVVQGLIVFASWRFVSRFTPSLLQRVIDAFLLTYFIQYAAVGLPGVCGVLSPTAMLATACVLSCILLFLTRVGGRPHPNLLPEGEGTKASAAVPREAPSTDLLLPPGEGGDEGDRRKASFTQLILLAGALLVTGYVAAYVWQQRYLPPLATDALTYHFPAAVQWLQHGRIDLFQTWFFNPANTYSPLAGSMFYAWLLGPIGDDTLAHFASAPMVVLIFLATAALVRSLGESRNLAPYEVRLGQPGVVMIALLAGLAVALSRPIVGQIDKGKDDLFLAAFFAVAAVALSPRRLRDPLGPWRLGVAIGLALAVKYTALFALPMLAVAIDALFVREPPRTLMHAGLSRLRSGPATRIVIAVACILAIAGPWYLRNLFRFGNPLFPTDFLGLRGLLSTSRSLELRSFAGVMGVLTSGAFAVPGALGVCLLFAWATAITTNARRTARDPLSRLVTLGPIVGIALFVFASPYPEIRFLVPAMILFAACVGRIGAGGGLLAFVAAVAAIVTGLNWELRSTLAGFILTGVMFAVVGVGLIVLQTRVLRWRRDAWLGVAGVVVLLIAGYTYIYWSAFVNDRQAVVNDAWAGDSRVKLWAFVRDQLPPTEPIAYTGTFTVYPLMGYHGDRPVIYLPLQAKVKTIADLPRIGDHLSGEQIQSAATAATLANADQAVWLANLRGSGVKHLAIFVNDAAGMPIELTWARALPTDFQMEYADSTGAVFRVVGH